MADGVPISREDYRRLRQESALSVLRQDGDVTSLPEVLLPYQSAVVGVLEDGTPVLVVEKSRRIGLTWGLASYAVMRAARQRQAGGMDVMYISYSQEMTREFIDACAMWARAFNLAALAVEEDLFHDPGDTEGDRSIQAFRIRFASGFEILALSSAPRSLRGKQGVVIIDEAAFVESLSELLKAALAFLMWGGQVVVCSTHDGAENPFNELVQDILAGRKKYAHLRIDFDEALEQGLFQRICMVRGMDWSPEAEAGWRQDIVDFYGDGADEELFCIPAQGSGAWLPGPLIEARMEPDVPVLRLELPDDFLHRNPLEQKGLMASFFEELDPVLETLDPDRLHAAGFDFARYVDLSVMPVLELQPDTSRRERLSIEMRRVPHNEQYQVFQRVMKKIHRLTGVKIDASGSGEWLAEQAVREFGARIEAVKITQDWYRVEMPPLKAGFEDNMIVIGQDAEHLNDLRLIKMIKGIARVPDLRTGSKGNKRHGDYGVALALAWSASRMQPHEYGYRAAGSDKSGRGQHPKDRGRDPYSPPLGSRLRGSI